MRFSSWLAAFFNAQHGSTGYPAAAGLSQVGKGGHARKGDRRGT
jgi:hypothetical protein